MKKWLLRLVLSPLICISAPDGAEGQLLDFQLSRLRDIQKVRLVLNFAPKPSQGGSCSVDVETLEGRAVSSLRAAGLEVLTYAENLRRVLEQFRLNQALVQALQEGRRADFPDAAENRRRTNELEHLRSFQSLIIRFHATPVAAGGANLCALAVFARLQGNAMDRTVPAANGHLVSANLLFWNWDIQSFVAREDDLADAVAVRVDDVLDAFLADWRRANHR